MRPYDHATDFIAVRDFLVATYAHFRRSYNWTIERWNFSVSMARMMNGVSLEAWANQIAIWEEGGELLGVVNWEGEREGEAFFQLAHEGLPDAVLQEMFDVCEARMGEVQDGRRVIYLRIPPDDARREAMAQARGFVRQSWDSPEGVMPLEEEFPVALLDGFAFVDGHDVSAEEKAMAHAKAFGYYGRPLYPQRAVAGFREMVATPDYRSDLDLHVRAPTGEIAAFATMWYDRRNRIGILEPVGTIPDFRRLGLARSAIYQVANQIQAEGAELALVGSDQDFYQSLGFEPRVKYHIWRKDVTA